MKRKLKQPITMIKKGIYMLIPLILLINSISCKQLTSSTDDHSIYKEIEQQMKVSNTHHKAQLAQQTKSIFPRSVDSVGKIQYVKSTDWTSGFYPGCLWLMYELTKNKDWKKQAKLYTEKIEAEQFNNSNHDIGFKIMCSFGNGFRLTKDPAYREVIIQSAQTLITRFNKNVGCIKSWDHHKERWQYPVIIDNLMNLELLFEASRLSGDPVYRNVAFLHASKTLKNHMRPNGSCFHVVDYNENSGEVIKKNTYQGYADSSSWARGQAWALYGFTMIYRETRQPEFLHQAEKTAQYILHHPNLSKDIIPRWDLDVPNQEQQPHDASAASIIASALYELATYSIEHKKELINKANEIINTLYLNNTNKGKALLLNHSTGNYPKNKEIDQPIIYADYYFLEALNKKNLYNFN